jgi:hypothetical protein
MPSVSPSSVAPFPNACADCYHNVKASGGEMRRRDFLGAAGGFVLTWPHAALAQPSCPITHKI